MRRAPIVVTATLVGTAGVLLFKPLTPGAASALGAGSDASGSAGSTSGTSATTTGSSGSSSSSASASSTPSASSSAKAPSSTTKSGSTTSIDAVVTGNQVTSRWGTTQVKVTITNGRITDVTTLQLNGNEQRSVEISQSAAPVLRTEVLSKQSAAVDAVSGATYTTEQYESSLQSALDKAGYTAPDKSKASTATTIDLGGR